MEMSDWKAQVTRPRGSIEINATDHGEYYAVGFVWTWFGIVRVFSQWDVPSSDVTFVYKGTEYRRNFDQAYSRQYLVTLADRFAREVVSEVDRGR